MLKTAFGEMIFNIGWKTTTEITLFQEKFEITVKLKAFGEQLITDQQNYVCEYFCKHKDEILKKVENLLKIYGNEKGFIPTTLLVQRNGDYAILLNDSCDEDGGIAVCLSPQEEVLMQDQYL